MDKVVYCWTSFEKSFFSIFPVEEFVGFLPSQVQVRYVVFLLNERSCHIFLYYLLVTLMLLLLLPFLRLLQDFFVYSVYPAALSINALDTRSVEEKRRKKWEFLIRFTSEVERNKKRKEYWSKKSPRDWNRNFGITKYAGNNHFRAI